MKEPFRENYFAVLKLLIAFVLELYVIINTNILSGASGQVLLLSALFIAAITFFELSRGKKQLLFWIMEGISLATLIVFYEPGFTLLLAIWILDIISIKTVETGWYLLGYITIVFTQNIHIKNHIVIITFLIIIYFQHGAVIHSYKSQLKEEELREQKLKKNINQNEAVYREEICRSLSVTENRILEEKTRLSQALHDKLGHSINGSIYQLEATKVLLETEPETCEAMLQAVIDNLRGSMDEIREILRQERPDKSKLAMLQLQGICDDCRKMNIDAKIVTKGNLTEIPDKYLEIILDNTFEAVSNALKYAKCTKIRIKIIVMNQLVRCTISDNGVGCAEIIDGMGISGMRKRMRSVNGILDFETDMGFIINMLLPL